MAASACEEYAARRINDNEQSPSAETRWNIFSAVDEIEAYTTLAAAPLPGLYVMPSGKSCTLRNIQIEDVAEYEADMPHRLTHKAVVTYSWQYEDTLDYEFEVSGQSVTITHSLDTVSYTGGGRTAPDFEGGININADGKIQGIDIDRPAFSFSVTKHWDFEYITQAYQVTLSKIVSTVNDAEYYGIPRGCVKLTGARGRKQGKKFPITYRFDVSWPESGIVVGDITVTEREGWWYLDVFRRTVSDTSSKKKIELPHSAYVHQVYPYSDFTLIGL